MLQVGGLGHSIIITCRVIGPVHEEGRAAAGGFGDFLSARLLSINAQFELCLVSSRHDTTMAGVGESACITVSTVEPCRPLPCSTRRFSF